MLDTWCWSRLVRWWTVAWCLARLLLLKLWVGLVHWIANLGSVLDVILHHDAGLDYLARWLRSSLDWHLSLD